MDFLYHFAQDSPRFLPIQSIILGLITNNYYLLSLGIFLIGNGIINLILKSLFKILYSFLKVKSLPILGIGDRPINNYTPDKIGYFDYCTNDAKLYGMPSGHSQSAWFFTVFAILYVLDKKASFLSPKKYGIIALLIIMAIFISYSRVRNNCHTIEQVIVGGLIGIFLGIGGYAFTKYII
jgi:membrane-associated phospholipid phosphatase